MRDENVSMKSEDIGGSWRYQGMTDQILCASGRLGQFFGGVVVSVLAVPEAWCDNSWPDLDSDGSLVASVH